MAARVVFGVVGALILGWLLLVGYLLARRPEEGTAREALRLLPDTVRLVKRLAADRSLPRSVRARLWILLAYLAVPFDLVPDFVPVIGYVDDLIVVGAVLRSVIRRAGPRAVRRHWPGTDDGLATIWRAVGLPGEAPGPPAR